MKTTFQKLTVVWPLVIFLLLPALTRGETAVQAWVQLYSGDSSPSAVAVDGSNNVIVTGTSTIKYSSTGVPLWTNANDINAVAVAVDGNNNVIVTCGDCVTVKYSSAGIPLWTNSYSGWYPRNVAYAMAVDSSNNVIVTAESAIVFPGGIRKSSGARDD